MSKKQLPELEALQKAGRELNALLKPNPAILVEGVTKKALAERLSTAAGLLEPNDTITEATVATLKGLGAEFRAEVKAGEIPPDGAGSPPPDPPLPKGGEEKDPHNPKQPGKTGKKQAGTTGRRGAAKPTGEVDEFGFGLSTKRHRFVELLQKGPVTMAEVKKDLGETFYNACAVIEKKAGKRAKKDGNRFSLDAAD